MLRKIWKVSLVGALIGWLLAGVAVMARGPHSEIVSRQEKIFFSFMIVLMVLVSADPWRKRFGIQLRGAGGVLLALAGTAGMIFAAKNMLAIKASPIYAVFMVGSAFAALAGVHLYEKYGCKHAPERPS